MGHVHILRNTGSTAAAKLLTNGWVSIFQILLHFDIWNHITLYDISTKHCHRCHLTIGQKKALFRRRCNTQKSALICEFDGSNHVNTTLGPFRYNPWLTSRNLALRWHEAGSCHCSLCNVIKSDLKLLHLCPLSQRRR